MAIEPKGPAPYTPAQTVIDLLEGFRNRGFPTPFSPEVLQRASIPDSLVNRTLQAFRIFELIDDKGNPTEQLVALKEARGDEEYRSRLQSWLTNIYAEVLKYADPATDDQKKVSEAFRGYTPEGQRSRMVTLMLGLFAYAGLLPETPKRVATPKPTRATNGAGARTLTQKQRRNAGKGINNSGQGGTMVHADIAPSVAGLLKDLPTSGRHWTTTTRDAWWRTFEVVLNYAYPTDDSAPESEDEE